jgi:DNA repair exonuclease SbcCD nuclease subunit
MPYRFVHAADIHLDSPLRSLALRDPDLAALIGNATRQAFVGIVDLCLAEQVDALLLAGDLYDGEQTSMKTARFLADQINRLHQAGIKVFIIRGNHDALSKITKELTFPDSVKLFDGRGGVVAIEGGLPVAIHGLSFAQARAPESLLPKYRPPTEGAVNIGLMHTSLDGAPGHDHYAPCALADLDASGFHYWALGHIHKRAINDGRAKVVMPGIPQGRDINESGPKSVALVTVHDDRTVTVEERLTSIAQFERVDVDLNRIDDWTDMLAAIEAALGRTRDATRSEHLVARLHFKGTTPLAWRIRRDGDLLSTEAAMRGSDRKTWIDKIEIECRAPGAATGPDLHPIIELRRLIDLDVLHSSAYRTEIAAIADELRNQLPPECRSLLGSDEEQARQIMDDLAREGAEDVLARLHATEAG